MTTILLKIMLYLLFVLISHTLSEEFEGLDPSCRNHFTNGYGYRIFFNLPPSAILKDGSVQFNFSVYGQSNGHILFSERPLIHPAYEVVLGAGGNTYSEIRKYESNRFVSKAFQLTTNIFSVTELRNFSISINQSVIAVSSNLNNLPWRTFLSWKDSHPLNIKFISFCAWTGITINWYYDCKGSKPVEEELTTLKKLKIKLLTNYDPYSIPVQNDDQLKIDTYIDIHHVNLDMKRSLLTTHGKFNFTWKDYRIKWNPAEFDNITSINFLHREIWIPEFSVYNSYDRGSSPMGRAAVRISHDGTVSWWPNAKMLTWCNLDLKDWPFDQHYCYINIGLHSHPESVHLSLSHNNLQGKCLKHLEWEVISLTGKTTNFINAWEINKTEDFTTRHRAFSLGVGIKRQTQMHIYSYFIPIIGSVVCLLSSFWLPVFSVKRLFIHSTCIFLLLLNLVSLDDALPVLPTSLPHIISFSSSLFLLSIINIIFASIIISTRYWNEPPSLVRLTGIICSPALKSVLFPFGDYNAAEEDNTTASEEVTANPISVNNFKLFRVLLDRLMFLLNMIYICVIVII